LWLVDQVIAAGRSCPALADRKESLGDHNGVRYVGGAVRIRNDNRRRQNFVPKLSSNALIVSGDMTET
jgi:hypothetical protein